MVFLTINPKRTREKRAKKQVGIQKIPTTPDPGSYLDYTSILNTFNGDFSAAFIDR